MTGLPDTLADFGPAGFAAVVVAGYLVVGEPFVGRALHRRFEAAVRVDPAARRSFYRRLLVLEWGLAGLVVLVWAAAPDVAAGQLGLRWPQRAPGVVTVTVVALVAVLVVVSVRALRSGALLTAPVAQHGAAPGQAQLALLPRTTAERRLFALVGVTAGVCEEWLYRGFFLAVLAAAVPGLPAGALVAVAAVAFGLAHAYQGISGVLTTGVLGGMLAGLYLQTGSLLLPVVLHALIDLRFLLVPGSRLPASGAAA